MESFIERCCNRRFTPGYTYETVQGTYDRELEVRFPDVRLVRSASLISDLSTAPTTIFTVLDIAAIRMPSKSGLLAREVGWPAPWVQIGYEHGMAAPPADLKRAAMRLCRELLVNEAKGQIPDNATNFQSSDLGWSAVLVTPGVRGAHTRLPFVNEAIDAWMFDERIIG